MRTLAEGISLALIGAGAVWGALLIPAPIEGEVGAGLFPLLIAVALLLIGVSMTINALRAGLDKSAESAGRQWIGISVLVGLSFVYWWSISALGYLLATALAAPLALLIFGVRKPLTLGLAAVLCPVVYHLIFFKALGVFPPYGEYFDLLDVIQGS